MSLIALLVGLGVVAQPPIPSGGSRSMTSLGDLDGDGHIELLVGRPPSQNPIAPAGCAVVYSSKDASVLRFYRSDAGCMLFGSSVARWADRDGDGVDEFAIGMPARGQTLIGCPDARKGLVFIYSGRTGELVEQLWGIEDFDEFGAFLSGGKDLDGDGAAELIVGTPGADRICVFSGRDGTCRWRIQGPAVARRFGTAVNVLDDLDGDGLVDLIVGAPGGTWGSAWIVSLRTGSVLREHTNTRYVASQDEAFSPSIDFVPRFGAAVSGTGDFDGDHVRDYLIGSGVNGQYAGGQANLYSGRSGALLGAFVQEFTFNRFGASVCGLGDLDGDLVPDFAVGDPNGPHAVGLEDGYSGRGTVTIYSGRTRGVLQALQAGDEAGFGTEVASIEDVDGDRVGELLVKSAGGPETPLITLHSGRTGQLLIELSLPGDSLRRAAR
jgi:hypothetical protein